VSGIKDPRFLDHEPFINLSRGIALISMIWISKDHLLLHQLLFVGDILPMLFL
jgi:hypothetical protein